MKVAIIGAGISGLSCAYALTKHFQSEGADDREASLELTVFESAAEIGGHTATKDIELEGKHYAIDTGFIVFNDWTYPNFIRLMDELGVASQPTEMSFSVTCELSGIEYSGTNLNTLFAQKRNLIRPSYWRMLRDILRFNQEAMGDLEQGRVSSAMTLGEYLKIRNYGPLFRDQYLVPMGSAIWSASVETMLNFPLLFFIRFFKNHGLLSVKNRPQWRVIKGGSRSYLQPLTQSFKDAIECNANIQRVQRRADGRVDVVMVNGDTRSFDQVVFACHSDQARALLADKSVAEEEVLGAMDYQLNDVVLHTDERMLPARKKAWSSWNYRVRESNQSKAVLTYDMNILQGLDADTTFCVTLNDTQHIDPNKILGRYQYSHPVFTLESIAASERWQDINGVNSTWFCGAYWANGFHEDGCVSGLRVADALYRQWLAPAHVEQETEAGLAK